MATAGKTTMARKLEIEKDAVRFTLDERMIAKFNYSIFDDEYGIYAAQEKLAIWEEAKAILDNDRDVILDWSLWSRQSRIEWSQRVIAEGYHYKLIYLEVPIETLRQRLSARNAEAPAGAHMIPLEELERFRGIFQPPTREENLNLEVIAWT
jgi:predicted kinase